MMSIAIYTLLLFFYIPALFSYPRETLLATILFCIFFIFFKMWLRSKSRYIVSTPLFLLGLFFIDCGISLVSQATHDHGSASAGTYGYLIIFCLLGGLFIAGAIKKKISGEKEASSLTQLNDLAIEKIFEEAMSQNSVAAWEELAIQGPLFMETNILRFRHKKFLADYLWPKKTVKLTLWDHVLYSAYQKKSLFYATKRIVELAENNSTQTAENNFNDPLYEMTEDRAVQKYPLSDYYNQLGWMYETGFGCQKDIEAAFQYYQKAVATGINTPCCPFDTYAAMKRIRKILSH